jgi:hypothetical protein
MIAKYGTLANFLTTVKGYSPSGWVFVSATGNDSTCVRSATEPTAEASPCATWDKAWSLFVTGDALIVRAGILYSTNQSGSYLFTFHGSTSSSTNYFLGYPGELAVLDHTVTGNNGLVNYSGNGDPSYIVVDGLKLQDTPCAGTNACGFGIDLNGVIPTTNVVVRNCEIRDYYDGIVAVSAQQGTLIERNVIHDNWGEHNIYEGNNSDDAHTSTITVKNNILYNAGRDNFHFNGVCTGCLLDANIIYSANVTVGGGTANVALQNGWMHSTVQNNIIFNASAWDLVLNPYGGNGNTNIVGNNSNYNLMVNNTFVYTGRDNTGQDEGGSGFAVVSAMNIDTSGNTPPAITMTTVAGSNVITLSTETAYLDISLGDTVIGAGIPANTTVTAGIGLYAYTLTLSKNATVSAGPGISVVTYHPWDVGHNVWVNNIIMHVAATSSSSGDAVRYQTLPVDYDWLTTDTWANNLIYISNPSYPLGDGVLSGYAVPQFAWSCFTDSCGVGPAGAFTNMTGPSTNPSLTAWNVTWYTTSLTGAWNLRPANGSPVIGAGTATIPSAVGGGTAGSGLVPTYDITGATRGNPPYIGAYDASAAGGAPINHCDLNNDGVVNIQDVLIAAAQADGSMPCGNADLIGDGTCNIADVIRVVNATLGGACLYH